MKNTKKVIPILAAAAILFSSAAANAADTYITAGFDNSAIYSEETTASTGNFEVDGTTFYLSSQIGQTFNAIEAPEPENKMEGTSLTTDGTDKALQIKIAKTENATPTGTAFFSTSLSSDLYDKGMVSLSCNVYAKTVQNITSVPLRIELRNSSNTSTTSTLIDFRSGGNLRFSDSTSYQAKYSTGKWYNVRVDIDTKAKTYKAYIDGEQLAGTDDIPMANKDKMCFAGDPESANLININQIRITTNNAKNITTASEVYIDDIYLGDAKSNSVEEIKLNSFIVKNGEEETDQITASTSSLTADAEFTYSEKTSEMPVAIYGAVYNQDGSLKKVYAVNDVIPQAANGNETKTVSLSMQFDGENALSSWDKIKVYLWKGDAPVPLAQSKTISVTEDKKYEYIADFDNMSSIGDYGITIGNGDYMTAEIATDDAEGSTEKVLKLVAKDVPSSGAPYITINPGEDMTGKVYIDYRLKCAEGGSQTHPRTLSMNGSDSYMLEYRPTAAINYYPNGENATASAKKFPRWAWANYHIEADLDNGTYTAYINEEEIGSGTLTVNTLEDLRFTIGYNKNYTTGSSTTYIDDIRVYTD